MKHRSRIAPAALAGVLAITASYGSDRIHASADLLWWSHDLELRSTGTSLDAGADDLAFRGDIFWGRIGVAAAEYTSDLDGRDRDRVEYLSVDLLWKALAPGEGAYLGIGPGWSRIDLGPAGFGGDTTGLRITVAGEVGFVYGKAAWMPDLDDFAGEGLNMSDVHGREWEFGVKLDFLRRLHVLVGWRSRELDFDVRGPGVRTGVGSRSEGWLVGVGGHF